MTEQEEQLLVLAMREGDVMWNPDTETARPVVSITKRAQVDEEPEPGLCANFQGRDYVALYNCELEEFAVTYRVRDRSGREERACPKDGTRA